MATAFWRRIDEVRRRASLALDGKPLPVEAPRAGEPSAPDASAGAMAALASRVGLDELAVDFLWYALAWSCDPLFAAFTASLAPEPQRGPTLVGFARISGQPAEALREFTAAMLAGTHPLLTRRLLGWSGPASTIGGLQVPTRTMAAARGELALDPQLAQACRYADVVDDLLLDEPQRAALAAVAAALAARPPVVAIIQARPGLGRRAFVGAAAAQVGRRALVLDVGRLGAASADEAIYDALERELALADIVPVILGADELPESDGLRRRRLQQFVEAVPGPLVLIVRNAGDAPTLARATMAVRLEPPAPPTRRALWRRALGAAADAIELGPVALRYRLGARDIGVAARVAQVLAGRRASPAALGDIVEGIRATAHETLAAVATRLTPRHTWDDLIVSDDVAAQLRGLIARGQHSYRVLHEWGLERLVPSSGMTALLSGPPGTGKTMAAGIIARELGLELYRIDLSAVMSKWIGETEKALGRVFDAADSGHALLLFDEADSLFAKRTEVRGATERYANTEVNFLLQRVESFHGVALLTTNMDTSLDPAFRRRIAAHIQFPHPDEDERLALWRGSCPRTRRWRPGSTLPAWPRPTPTSPAATSATPW
jgi:hypothetical protein